MPNFSKHSITNTYILIMNITVKKICETQQSFVYIEFLLYTVLSVPGLV